MSSDIREFMKEREILNDTVMKYADLSIKRFYNLDSKVYEEGALSRKVKELMGLVASLVLRCDDCIKYHIVRCFEEGITDDEFTEAVAIALVVGGSITIPHVRRAFKAWDEMKKEVSCQDEDTFQERESVSNN